MQPWEPVHVGCPYCGEPLEIVIDDTAARQQCVEDCRVCCHPIQLRITVDAEGRPSVDARREDE